MASVVTTKLLSDAKDARKQCGAEEVKAPLEACARAFKPNTVEYAFGGRVEVALSKPPLEGSQQVNLMQTVVVRVEDIGDSRQHRAEMACSAFALAVEQLKQEALASQLVVSATRDVEKLAACLGNPSIPKHGTQISLRIESIFPLPVDVTSTRPDPAQRLSNCDDYTYAEHANAVLRAVNSSHKSSINDLIQMTTLELARRPGKLSHIYVLTEQEIRAILDRFVELGGLQKTSDGLYCGRVMSMSEPKACIAQNPKSEHEQRNSLTDEINKPQTQVNESKLAELVGRHKAIKHELAARRAEVTRLWPMAQKEYATHEATRMLEAASCKLVPSANDKKRPAWDEWSDATWKLAETHRLLRPARKVLEDEIITLAVATNSRDLRDLITTSYMKRRLERVLAKQNEDDSDSDSERGY